MSQDPYQRSHALPVSPSNKWSPMSTSPRFFTSADILRAAASIIERHGQDAVVVTAEQADKLLGEGDKEGATVLWTIIDALEELLRRRSTEEHLN